MKKLLVALLFLGMLVMMTSPNEESQKQKQRNIERIEENIKDYISE